MMPKEHNIEIVPLENEKYNFLARCITCSVEGRFYGEFEAREFLNKHIGATQRELFIA